MKKKLRRLIFIGTLALLASSCNQDDGYLPEQNLQQLSDHKGPGFQVVYFGLLPEGIQSQALVKSLQTGNLQSRSSSEIPFGEVVKGRVNQLIFSDITTYTFRLENLGEGLYYDNLIVVIDTAGKTRQYKVRYEPEAEWYYKRLNGEADYNTYVGDITIFDENGNAASAAPPRKELSALKKNSAQRTIELDEVVVCGNCDSGGGGGTPIYIPSPSPIPTPNPTPPPTTSPPPEDGGGGGVPTVPNDGNGTDQENLNPCDELKTLSNKADFKAKLDELKGKVNEKKEHGYVQNTSGAYTALTASDSGHSLNIVTGSSNIGYIHTHLNPFESGETDPEGNPQIIKPIPMFSPGDVKSFLGMVDRAYRHNRPVDQAYGVMVSGKGTYVLKFTGNAKEIWKKTNDIKWNDLKEDYIKYFDRYGREKAFLSFLKDKIKIDGIELYKRKNNGTFQKRYLSENGKRVESEDC